jgi:hypothetical protein
MIVGNANLSPYSQPMSKMHFLTATGVRVFVMLRPWGCAHASLAPFPACAGLTTGKDF